jgi:hypothetical protein
VGLTAKGIEKLKPGKSDTPEAAAGDYLSMLLRAGQGRGFFDID